MRRQGIAAPASGGSGRARPALAGRRRFFLVSFLLEFLFRLLGVDEARLKPRPRHSGAGG